MKPHTNPLLIIPAIGGTLRIPLEFIDTIKLVRGRDAVHLLLSACERLDLSSVMAQTGQIVSTSHRFPRVIGYKWIIETEPAECDDRELFVSLHEDTSIYTRAKRTSLLTETDTVTLALLKEPGGAWLVLDFTVGPALMPTPTHPLVIETEYMAGCLLFWTRHALLYTSSMISNRYFTWEEMLWEVIWNHACKNTSVAKKKIGMRAKEIFNQLISTYNLLEAQMETGSETLYPNPYMETEMGAGTEDESIASSA